MAIQKSRHRTHIDPFPVPGNKPILLGYFQDKQANGQWGNPYGHTYAQYSSIDLPGVRAKAMWDEVHKGPPFDSGGPMRSIHIECAAPFGMPAGKGTYVHPNGNKRYVGGFMMPGISAFGPNAANLFYGSSFNTALLYTNSQFSPSLASWGSKAWSNTAPRLEKAGGAVFLAELRDIPHMLKTTSRLFRDIWRKTWVSSNAAKRLYESRIMQPKVAADHFLNHQFGWRPFHSDLSSFYDTMVNARTIIDRLSDENGLWIRNRATLKDDSTATSLGGGQGMYLFPNTSFTNSWDFWFTGQPTYEVWEESTTHITSVGKFRYYRPEFDRDDSGYFSLISRLRRQMTIYGLRISPSNIYKATPWTWAADWVSDAGRYVSRLNDIVVDSVASKYLYVTERKVLMRHYRATLPFANGTLVLHWTMLKRTIAREEASSPYGFGLTLANLTPRQLAIAGALGLTRFF